MTATPISQQSEGMRRPRNLIVALAFVICSSVVSMFVLNVPAVAPTVVLVLAAILLFAFWAHAKKA